MSAREAPSGYARANVPLHSRCSMVSCSLFRIAPNSDSLSAGTLQMSSLIKSSLLTRLDCNNMQWHLSSSRNFGTSSLTHGFESRKGSRCLGPCCVNFVKRVMNSSMPLDGVMKLVACNCCTSALEKCMSRHFSMILCLLYLDWFGGGDGGGASGPAGPLLKASPLPLAPAGPSPLPLLSVLPVVCMFFMILSISSSSSSTCGASDEAWRLCASLVPCCASGLHGPAPRSDSRPASRSGWSPSCACSGEPWWILYHSHSSSALRRSFEIARLPRETCLAVRLSMLRRNTSAPASMRTCTTGTWDACPARCSGVHRCEPPLRFRSKTLVQVRTRFDFFCSGWHEQVPLRHALLAESMWLSTKQMPRSCPRRAARCSGAHLSLFIMLQSASCCRRMLPMALARLPPLSNTDMRTWRGVLPSASF
mmetsp:Transcript_40043/g.113236  ORF Transcript_40043/g.113236 Transcript_40043/m.113236 type:complete len:422 (-) Transcript_40043:243-1508(-)